MARVPAVSRWVCVQLVVLSDAAGANGGSGLVVAGEGGYGDVGDRGVFGFTGGVRRTADVAHGGHPHRRVQGFQGLRIVTPESS